MRVRESVVGASVFALGLGCIPNVGNAETIRCGTELVREGALSASIREKCGDPASIETTTEPTYERRPDGTTYQVGVAVVEYWHYDFGARQFPVRITVKGGVAEKIELVSRTR